MGLQAQMKTSLPWPFSMLTLLLGMAVGPASGIAVSTPFACGLLQHAPTHDLRGLASHSGMPGGFDELGVMTALPSRDAMQNVPQG